MSQQETLILTRKDVASLISLEECINAVEQAFLLYAEGKAAPPSVLSIHGANDGAFHIKAGVMQLDRNYFVAKTNGNYPRNPATLGLPTIQGVVVVCDADNGRVLCLMDSMELTILRTGAATAVAAKHLSKKASKVVTIWGCGTQGRISVRMLSVIRPIETVYLYDIDRSAAERAAEELKGITSLSVVVIDDPFRAALKSDICVTCTTSRKPIIDQGHLKPGTFLAAVGADSEHKHEIHPAVLKSSKVVVDLIDQASKIGDLHHAIEAGLLTSADVYAELGEVIAGKKQGRISDDEIIVFDSTGMALQDVAAASIVYKRAKQMGTARAVILAD
jgi:alanine dehydrogenase